MKTSIKRLSVVSVLAACASACPVICVFPPSTSWIIEGQVKDRATGEPVDGIRVNCIQDDPAVSLIVISGPDRGDGGVATATGTATCGTWTPGECAPGYYRCEVNAAGDPREVGARLELVDDRGTYARTERSFTVHAVDTEPRPRTEDILLDPAVTPEL